MLLQLHERFRLAALRGCGAQDEPAVEASELPADEPTLRGHAMASASGDLLLAASGEHRPYRLAPFRSEGHRKLDKHIIQLVQAVRNCYADVPHRPDDAGFEKTVAETGNRSENNNIEEATPARRGSTARATRWRFIWYTQIRKARRR